MVHKNAYIQKTSVFLFHFFVPAFFIIGVVTYIVYSIEIRGDLRLTQNIESEIVRLNQQALSEELDTVFSDLSILANNTHLTGIINGDPGQSKAFGKDLVIFSKARKFYDQIRFIDDKGMERVRVNAGAEGPYVVPGDKLQSKKNRYYFKDTFELGTGQFFVSPLDLNIEHGVIETPLKPMVRFGTPVFNDAGEKKGVVILNYYGQRLIDTLTSLGRKSSGKILLVNSDGYYLKGPTPDDEWGFMFPDRENKRFPAVHGAAWEEIRKEPAGQMIQEGSLFTYATINPVPDQAYTSSGSGKAFTPSSYWLKGKGYTWKIISLIPRAVFHQKGMAVFMKYMGIVIPVLLIVGVGAWFLTSFKLKRIQAEKALVESNEHLEATVAVRTESLMQMNTELNSRILELSDARDSIRDSERYYRALIDHIQEDILVIDPGHTVTDVNETLLQRTGLEREQALGRPCYEVSHEHARPCDIDKNDCPLFDVLKTGETRRSVHQYGKDNGGEIWVENVFSPLRNSQGAITHMIKVTRDITEEKYLESQLRQAQKMEAIGRLAGGIAHDFNNILFPILGYTEMALDEVKGDNKDLKDFLDEIFSGVIRAKNLVTQILAFSYQAEQENKPLKINIVVKEALKLLKSSIPSTIEFQTEIDPECLPVLCDATQIHQIVMNLCTNAYQAMASQPGKIIVSLGNVSLSHCDLVEIGQMAGPYVCLKVSDNGQSIDPKIMDRIFEPYFTTKEKGSGTGLGLSVVRNIVKSFGGYISVESEKGAGTQFTLYFPAIESGGEQDVKADAESFKISTATGEHLMIVDDDPTILNLEKKALMKLGYQISSYISSEDAYEAFMDHPETFDMVVTDYTMPNLTGEGLARKINHAKKDVPIILLTGFSAKIHPEKAKSIGIKAHVSKPVILSQLARTIRLVLDGDDDENFFPRANV